MASDSTAILPARSRRLQDKAKVEQAILMVERWLLGRLSDRRIYSNAEVNAAIAELLTKLVSRSSNRQRRLRAVIRG
jgi:hypothetical protein